MNDAYEIEMDANEAPMPPKKRTRVVLVDPARLAALEAAERELHTLRVGCEAALQDWQLQRIVDDGAWSPRPGGNDMLRGCVYVYDDVIPLLTKILDGTVVDNDFDEAEYNLMLTAGTTDRAALRAVTEAENERIRQEMRGPADGITAARDEHREDKTNG